MDSNIVDGEFEVVWSGRDELLPARDSKRLEPYTPPRRLYTKKPRPTESVTQVTPVTQVTEVTPVTHKQPEG